MTILRVRHQTRYKYRSPVELGEHRLMMRPRDSHDLRLLSTSIVDRAGRQSIALDPRRVR